MLVGGSGSLILYRVSMFLEMFEKAKGNGAKVETAFEQTGEDMATLSHRAGEKDSEDGSFSRRVQFQREGGKWKIDLTIPKVVRAPDGSAGMIKGRGGVMVLGWREGNHQGALSSEYEETFGRAVVSIFLHRLDTEQMAGTSIGSAREFVADQLTQDPGSQRPSRGF